MCVPDLVWDTVEVLREDIHMDDQQIVPTVLFSTNIVFGGAGEVADNGILLFSFEHPLWCSTQPLIRFPGVVLFAL